MAIKYGVSFILHDKWLTPLVINAFLETSNKYIDILREMKKKKPQNRRKWNNTSDYYGLKIYEDDWAEQ